MEEKFFTTEQVANILQLHPFTILKFIREGKLKGLKLGRVYRIKESDVNQFIEDRMTQPSKVRKKEVKDSHSNDNPPKKESQVRDPSKDDHYYII